MIDCPACQKPNPEGASFCIYCGGSLPDSRGSAKAAVEGQGPAPGEGTVPGHPATGAFQPKEETPAQLPGGLAPQTVIDGKYTIESVLGEGGMGVVYLARDIHVDVPVVVKAIRAEYAHRQEFRRRILAEARALATIDHLNVVRMYAVVVEPEALYLIMQFIEGESLDKTVQRYVDQQTPMPVELVLKIFYQVLEGVGAAHAEGVIHRDLKPANILIRQRDAVVKVTDFGIAKAEEDAQAGRGQTKGIIGSLLYMAPEQIKGRRDLDKRVDIYGLGILLYELLVGRVPFDAPSELEIMKLHLEGQVPMISQMRADVPAYIDAVIHKACAKRREDRFGCTQEMAVALRAGQNAHQARGENAATAEAGPAPEALRSPEPSHEALPNASEAWSEASPEAPSEALAEAPAEAFAPSPMAGSTPEGISASSEQPGHARFGWGIAAGIALVALVAGGLWGAWYYDLIDFDSPTAPATAPPILASSDASTSASAAPVKDPQPENPLQALQGTWVSDSGRIYDASLTGDKLQFRIRDASGLERSGYVDGEPRFTLSALADEMRTFAVEDKIRPALPAGMEYDLSRARATCQEVWSSVGGRPLRARYDGTRLTVEGAKMEPDRSMFLREGGKVVGCVRLSEAKATRLEGIFRRRE